MLDWVFIGFWNWLLCWIWPSHKLYVAEQLSEASQRLRCCKCGRQYAINHDVRAVLAWDADFERFYQMRRLMEKGEG